MTAAMYLRFGKVVFDVALAGLALISLLPLLLFVSILIRLEDGGPALFRQMRSGKDGNLFELLKFRSMPIATVDMPSTEARNLSITRVGRFIRRTNIDELPQLINILRGDMSLVGPRPALPSQAMLLALRAKSGATALRPGLTGMAQINSYDGMHESEKAAFDSKYVSTVSFLTDLGIILRTFTYLLKPPPVY